jgi:hypothetical protein
VWLDKSDGTSWKLYIDTWYIQLDAIAASVKSTTMVPVPVLLLATLCNREVTVTVATVRFYSTTVEALFLRRA